MQKIKLKHVMLFVGVIGIAVALVAIFFDGDGVYNDDLMASRCLSSVVGGEVSAGNIYKMHYFGDKGESFYRYKYSDGCFVDVVVSKSGLCDVLGVFKTCGLLKDRCITGNTPDAHSSDLGCNAVRR